MRRPEGLGPQVHRFQQPLDGRAHSDIVINDEHRGCACGYHSFASILVRRVKQKLAPRGELSAAHKRPPCDSTIERLIHSPRPVPSDLVVKNALKICSICCGGSPTPVSLTVTVSCPFSARCDLMASWRVSSTSFIASMPLTIRFMSTCCNCTRSPMIRGISSA